MWQIHIIDSNCMETRFEGKLLCEEHAATFVVDAFLSLFFFLASTTLFIPFTHSIMPFFHPLMTIFSALSLLDNKFDIHLSGLSVFCWSHEKDWLSDIKCRGNKTKEKLFSTPCFARTQSFYRLLYQFSYTHSIYNTKYNADLRFSTKTKKLQKSNQTQQRLQPSGCSHRYLCPDLESKQQCW